MAELLLFEDDDVVRVQTWPIDAARDAGDAHQLELDAPRQTTLVDGVDASDAAEIRRRTAVSERVRPFLTQAALARTYAYLADAFAGRDCGGSDVGGAVVVAQVDLVLVLGVAPAHRAVRLQEGAHRARRRP